MQIASTSVSIRPMTTATVHVGGAALLGAVGQLAGAATTDVLIDAFRIDHQPVIDALGAAAQRGVAVSVLADTRELEAVNPKFDPAVSVVGYGRAPAKQHSKSMTIDGGSRGLVGTDMLGADALTKLEFAIEVDGAAARALRGIEEAARHPKRTGALRDAADAAAKLGIVANEPTAGVQHVTEAVEQLIEGASERLLIVSRTVDDPKSIRRLIDAAGRGVQVDVLGYDENDPGTISELERGGVNVHVLDKAALKGKGLGIHGLQLVADGAALVSGAYLMEKMLHGVPGRRSRELGMLLGGEPAKVVADAVAQLLPS